MNRNDNRAAKLSQSALSQKSISYPSKETWSTGLAVPRDLSREASSNSEDVRPARGRYSDNYLVRDYIKDAAKAAPLLSLAEEQELGMRRIAGDEEARQRLIKSNLLFVVAVAKSFWASA